MSTRSVITLANSIIGVSILAMPFCFKQCGIILATIMLLLCGMLVKVTCHLLIKSALVARRKNYELLAFHTFGHVGKLFIEIGISGFLGGTAIAFFVVMGDLGPPLTANLLSIENSANLRLVILTGLGLFVALPLSFMRNIESLSVICASSIGFYLLVVLRVVLQAVPNIISTDWMSLVNLWRPAGMLQCFPIFSMALSCQANVFEVYGSLKDATPGDMNEVVRGAVNLCTAIYITIGFFGYVAFCHIDNLSGNILTAFPQSHMLDVVKFGFLTSVAVSFPLVIFPCRTSIHSLLFRKTYRGIESTELVTDYITPLHFNLITTAIIVISLIIGILIPDIELVLGLVGSTMGASICVVFPAAVFLTLTTRNTTERVAAKAIFVIGIVTMILGTYVNLFEPTTSSPSTTSPRPALIKPTMEPVNVLNSVKGGETADNVLKNISDAAVKFDDKKMEAGKNSGEEHANDSPKRQEPANPVPPKDTISPLSQEDPSGVKDNDTIHVKVKDTVAVVEDKESKEQGDLKQTKKESKADKVVTRDKKEENEKTLEKTVRKAKKQKEDTEKEADKLLAQLERQKKEQQKIIQQQKDILNDLKIHQEKERMAEEKKAIVDAVQQYNLQGAGVMQQHIPANPQQVPLQQQQVVPVQSADNVVQPQAIQQPQPVFPQQQRIPQQPIVPQQQPLIPLQQQIVPQVIPQPQAVPAQVVPQPQQPQIVPQQQPIVPQQQQQPLQQQVIPQQQAIAQQQQPVVQPQQQHQQFVPQQQVIPQVIPQQAVPVQLVPQQQQPQIVPQQPQVVPQQQQQPLQQQNLQGVGVQQQNVQPEPGQALQQVQVAQQQPSININQQPFYQPKELPQQPIVSAQVLQPVLQNNVPVASMINNLPFNQQQQIPQQPQQKPQPVEPIQQNPAPQSDALSDNQQKHVIADYGNIQKQNDHETGDGKEKQDSKVPSRDLKDAVKEDSDEHISRKKREVICENDPDCDEKFAKVDFNKENLVGIAAAGRDLLEYKDDLKVKLT